MCIFSRVSVRNGDLWRAEQKNSVWNIKEDALLGNNECWRSSPAWLLTNLLRPVPNTSLTWSSFHLSDELCMDSYLGPKQVMLFKGELHRRDRELAFSKKM